MLETLHLLCQILAKDSVTIQEVAHAVGSGKTTTSADKPIVIEPRDSEFQRVEIWRFGNRDIPTHVTLTLGRGRILLLAQLRAVYGDFHTLPRGSYQFTQRVMFRVKEWGMTSACAIIADLDTERATDDSRVTVITVRRERTVE